MFGTLAATMLLAAKPTVGVTYAPFRGLEMKVADTALIEGSGFQYYERGWKRGYFSSAWKPIDVRSGENGSIVVVMNSDDGLVGGTQVFRPREDGFDATASFRWRGEKPAMLEFAVGRLWAPLLADGTLKLDGAQAPSLKNPIRAGSSFEERVFGRPAKEVIFDAPSAKVTIRAQRPIHVMDARNHSVEWADDKELFWLGYTDVELEPQEAMTFEYSITIDPKPHEPGAPKPVATEGMEILEALGPDSRPLPLAPQPKNRTPRPGFTDAHAGFTLDLPSGLEAEPAWFNEFLQETWEWQPNAAAGKPFPVKASLGINGMPSGGYLLSVSESGATIQATDRDGVRYALRTLALLTRPQKGRLVVERGEIRDWPSASWRGVHKFVGPTALQFQGKLLRRALALMKLNKIVLQCERTDWDTLPGIETSITMSKKDLKALVAQYRSLGFEFIPLVQSLGHMEWFFENDKNLDMAINPKIPYTIDPRKAKTRAVFRDLWAEVIGELNPTTVHFGLDEIGMRGMPNDPGLETRLWKTSVPELLDIAKKHNVKAMFWSDMMLAKEEAVDAQHGDSPAIAKDRRSVLQKGYLIGDWHYKDDPNPDVFDKSLKLWNSIGMKPIATTWNRPGNIRGFTLSAIRNNAGVLQSTWAGYESSEANMVRSWDQFHAYILMAEYAWSGRTEMPNKIGYDPAALLQRLYFGGRSAVSPLPGHAILPQGSRGKPLKVGTLGFRLFDPIQLFGSTTNQSFGAPDAVNIPVGKEAANLAVALDCLARVNEVVPVVDVAVNFADGSSVKETLRYGTHLRSVTDDRATIASARIDGLSGVRLSFPKKMIESVTITAIQSAAGTRVHGVSVF